MGETALSELLFFDTFSHECSEEINLDLVQFTKTVSINEIRIIPLGARVQADFPGGVRLGATNPSQFKIEFFVNDLSKPGASTFESLGGVEYNQNGNINLECDHMQIPTDGLVLRGWYTTITLAVYGRLAKAVIQEIPPPGSVPPHPDARAPPDAIGPNTNAATAEWVQQHAQAVVEMPPVEHGYMVEPPRDPYASYAEETYHPPAEYPAHHYQEEWPQAAHGEGYDATKEGYEGEMMNWERGGGDEKLHWERERSKERERDLRHRGEREYRGEHGHEISPEYDRSRTPRDYHFQQRLRGPPTWPNRPRSPPPIRPGARTPPLEGEVRSSISPHESVKREATSPPVPFDSLSPGDVESISEGEIPEAEGETEVEVKVAAPVTIPTPPPAASPPPEEQSMETEQFEPILSDEEIADDCDPQFQDMDYDFNDYADDPVKSFNPYSFEMQNLLYLGDPAQSVVEREMTRSQPVEKTTCLEDLIRTVTEDRGSAAAKEEWVHAAEQIESLLVKNIASTENKDDVISKVISWIKIGLDFNEALNQPQPGYKLRHLKVGIRLVEAISQCGQDVVEKLSKEVNVQEKLIELYHQDYMALSIKLMILRALDASLRYESEVKKFTGEEYNGYKKLLEMVQGNQLARVKFAITSVIQKVHFYEVLDCLTKGVNNLMDESKKDEENSEINVDSIATYLDEIVRFYINAPTLLSQPKRFLPVSSQFEIGINSYPDPYPAIFTYFRIHKLLGSFVLLLSHPIVQCCSSVVVPIHEMLWALLDSQDGMRFLAATPDVTSQLVRILLSGGGGSEEGDEAGQTSAGQLGLSMVYRLQGLVHIDALNNLYHKGKTDPDNAEVIEHLQCLFCLGFNSIGKMSVVHILSQGDNINTLLDYFKTKITEKDVKIKKSPGCNYIVDLIVMTVKYSDYVPFIQTYAKELLDIINKDTTGELNEIVSWLKPGENQSAFTYDDISPLCEIIKKNVENATSLPGELITAVRILKYLGIPPREKDVGTHSADLEFCELKYKCVILQLFSLEGVANLIAVIQKLCENYEQPALHGARLIGRQGLTLTSFMLPAIQLIRRVLTNVIKCRNTDFKDLTAIPILLQTYTLMQSIPINAHAHSDAQRVCREIIETFLAYTQPVSSETSSETEALNKSLWTLMLSEVLKYVIVSPHTFMSGLSVISELLPLPLQVQTRTPLPEEEIMKVVNSRKLWSAHLHSLNSLIHDLIVTLSGSSYQPLLQLLRSVCIQLADLAAPTALTVTRAVLDALSNAITVPIDRPLSGHVMRLITLLACLINHASIKASFIHLTVRNSQTKTDERYPNLIISLSHILRAAFDSPVHIQAQECIVSIIQSLCHTELTLLPPPGMLLVGGGAVTPPEIYLANTLPPRDLLGTLILVMLEHLSNAQNSLTTMQPIVRTFVMLTEHDYGFFHLKNCLEKKTEAMWTVITKLCSCWSKERPECLSTLSVFLELARACLSPDEADESLGLPARALVMTTAELAVVLAWERTGDDNKHPLYKVNALLQESRAEDDTLESLCENVSELIHLLEEESGKPVEAKETVEPVLPSPDSLLAQFTARPVFIVGEVDDERLSAAYWLSTPPPDDQDTDMEQVSCDLMEIARVDLPEVSLAENVAQLCRHKAAPGDLEHAATCKKRTNSSTSELNNKRPFVAPMRGRGFRGSVQRGDMFRSRPPNTSRPPSLHVDDFVALETCGQQPTGPTGYNKISMRAAQDLMATRARGRGRAFGIDRGGRFFSGSSPYARRESNSRSGSPVWHGEGNGSASNNGTQGTGHNFRAPHPDMRSIRPEGQHSFATRSVRAPPPLHSLWGMKDSRERFPVSNMRGGPTHRESQRHMRFFSR